MVSTPKAKKPSQSRKARPYSPITEQLKKSEKEARRVILTGAVRLLQQDKAKRNGGNATRGFFQNLISRYHEQGHTWIRKNLIEAHMRRMNKTPKPAPAAHSPPRQQPSIDSRNDGQPVAPSLTGGDSPITSPPDSVAPPNASTERAKGGRQKGDDEADCPPDSVAPSNPSSERSKGGRPKGTTVAAKRKREEKIKWATEQSAIKMASETKKFKAMGKKCPNGTLKRVIAEVEKEAGLVAGSVNSRTVHKRVYRGNATGRSESTTAPLAEVEPIIAQKLVQIGQPLVRDKVISLAIDMIKGTPHEEALRKWKEKHVRCDDNSELLSAKWYQNFVKRNADVLKPVRARR